MRCTWPAPRSMASKRSTPTIATCCRPPGISTSPEWTTSETTIDVADLHRLARTPIDTACDPKHILSSERPDANIPPLTDERLVERHAGPRVHRQRQIALG